ncbi:hypothetical protein FACS189499_05230 [Clostridia bacterium]|nr:hypothetical protein FACS189499_05230 [Clostridia bacterium]
MFNRNDLLIRRKYIQYLIPIILTTCALSIANLLTSIIVGNLLGSSALAAVSLLMPVFSLFNLVNLLFAVGGVACASVAKGKRDDRQANNIFTVTLLSGILIMCVFSVLMFVFKSNIALALAGGKEELARMVLDYLEPISFLGPIIMTAFVLSQFVRIDGFPNTSLLIIGVANIVNLAMIYILIHFFGMGLAGAAWSMVIGYACGVLSALPYIFSKKRFFKLIIPTKQDIKTFGVIVKTGMPQAVTYGMEMFRALVLNMIIVSTLGALGMTAMAVCLNAISFTFIFIGGSTETLIPIVGTLRGEKDYYGIIGAAKTGFKVILTGSAVTAAALLLFPAFIGGIFGVKDTDGLAVLIPALRMYSLSIPLYGMNQGLQRFYQTTGRENLASLFAALESFVFVIAFALVLTSVNPSLIWLAFMLSEAATFIVVILAGMKTRKKESIKAKNGFQSILLLSESEPNGQVWDTSICATIDMSVALSEQVVAFCKEHGTSAAHANFMGIAVEEMAVNISKYAHGKNEAKKPGTIDILIRVTESELILRFRDDGATFDPTAYSAAEYKKEYNGEEKCAVGGLEVIKRLSGNIDYSRQLGFNSTVITFSINSLNSADASLQYD